jgi:hypothetical protein
MEQYQAIKKILLETENLQAHFKRLAKPGNQLHPLDIDLMMEKMRGLYEEVIKLYEFTPSAIQETPFLARKAEPQEQPKPQHAEPATVTPAIPLPEKIIIVDSETTAVKAETISPAPAETTPPAFTLSNSFGSPVIELHPDIPVPDIRTESPESKTHSESTKPAVKTTLDLFAQAGMESIASRLGSDDDASVAARMQRAKINDLRSAIGINDKFLFINELFRGNMQQYNKVLDELNDFRSLGGAQTYLMELKVEHQWDAESNAFVRLSSFIERRFGS